MSLPRHGTTSVTSSHSSPLPYEEKFLGSHGQLLPPKLSGSSSSSAIGVLGMILWDDYFFTLSPWNLLAFIATLWSSTTLSPPNLLGRTINVNNWPLKDRNSELLDKSAEGDDHPCKWRKMYAHRRKTIQF